MRSERLARQWHENNVKLTREKERDYKGVKASIGIGVK